LATNKIRLSEEIEGDGPIIFAHACRHQLEGMCLSGGTLRIDRDGETNGARRNAFSRTPSW
jgi:hypothetical protein